MSEEKTHLPETMQQHLSEERGQALIKLARGAILNTLGDPLPPDPTDAWLKERAATFVTITRGDRLHGCIGTIEAKRTILEDVKHNAVAAAFFDPRATPLVKEDIADLRIEVSILSPLEPIAFAGEADALSKLRPHVDGVVLAHNGRRATFLPQVWESLPSPAEFMTHLKLKAGLSPTFWADNVQLFRYSLEKWSEPKSA